MPRLYADTKKTDKGMTIKLTAAPKTKDVIAVIARDGSFLALSISNNATKHGVLQQGMLESLLIAGWTPCHGGAHLGDGGGSGWFCGISGIRESPPVPGTFVDDLSDKVRVKCDLAYEAALDLFRRILAKDELGRHFSVTRQVYQDGEHTRH
jgi:hypothetical protein